MMSLTKHETRTAAVKDAIRAAATDLFSDSGFAATGVREIAAAARVDPALVIRHFGSKEGLFLETMQLPNEWATVTDGPIDSVGERIVRFVAEHRQRVGGGGIYSALVRASDRPEVRQQVLNIANQVFVAPLANRIPADGVLRAHLLAAQVSGLMHTIWITEDPELITVDVETLVAWYAPTLQFYVTGTLESRNS